MLPLKKERVGPLFLVGCLPKQGRQTPPPFTSFGGRNSLIHLMGKFLGRESPLSCHLYFRDSIRRIESQNFFGIFLENGGNSNNGLKIGGILHTNPFFFHSTTLPNPGRHPTTRGDPPSPFSGAAYLKT
jgi:hypothetical protein